MTFVSGKGDNTKIPQGGILYDIFGEGINLSEFAPLLDKLNENTLKLLSSVGVRISLINTLDSLNHSPSNSDFASLQLYLLCTCIDVLANPSWLPFNDWLSTKKAKYYIKERDNKLEKIFIEQETIKDIQVFVNTILDLYDEYLIYNGTNRKFGAFFIELPDFVKEFIASSYQIFKGDEDDFDPEVLQKWLGKSIDEKLLEIARYLYKYRRNEFTHAGRTYSTTWESFFHNPQEALATRPYKSSGGLLYFWSDDNPDKDIELIVNAQHNEVFLLQTTIILYCRRLIGIVDEEYFLLKMKARHHQSLIIRNVFYELQHNWKTYKFYSIKWMAYEYDGDLHFGMPEFHVVWLEAALELDYSYYSEYGVPEFDLIQETKSVILSLQNLNEPIRKVNEKYPPLYIRNRDKTLIDQPEDFRGKKVAIKELIDAIQNMNDYHQVSLQVPNLLSIYTRLLIDVPYQKVVKMQITYRPDFFNLM